MPQECFSQKRCCLTGIFAEQTPHTTEADAPGRILRYQSRGLVITPVRITGRSEGRVILVSRTSRFSSFTVAPPGQRRIAGTAEVKDAQRPTSPRVEKLADNQGCSQRSDKKSLHSNSHTMGETPFATSYSLVAMLILKKGIC